MNILPIQLQDFVILNKNITIIIIDESYISNLVGQFSIFGEDHCIKRTKKYIQQQQKMHKQQGNIAVTIIIEPGA